MRSLICALIAGCLVPVTLFSFAFCPRTLAAQEVVLVQQGTTMVYRANTSDPGIGQTWTERLFNEAGWTSGSYGVGYEENPPPAGMIETQVPVFSRSVYTRVHFAIADLAQVQTLHFGADYDDGIAAWVNGVAIARLNVPAGNLDWDHTPDNEPVDHESSNGATATYDPIMDVTTVGLPALRQGDNVLAVGVWNNSGRSSDLALVPFLSINRPPPVSGTEVCGTLAGNTRWTLAQSPYVATCDVVIPAGSTLTIDAGVQVYLDSGVDLTVNGQIYALGETGSRIRLTHSASGSWGGIDIDHNNDGVSRECIVRFADISYASTLVDVNRTGNSSILVEDCTLDSWSSLAFHWDNGSNGLRIRRCEIGLNTPAGEQSHETINGYRSGAVVEYCTFGHRRGYNDVVDLGSTNWGGPVPTVQYNTFLGGDDDAIDFDGSAGWIIGNLVMDHWPAPGSGSANGGGITGNDASEPVVVNNIVYHCYHGIGYKNGTTPLIMNNLVIDCNIGVTFYKDACSAAPPRPVLYNNIIWNNHNAVTGALTNVVLNGRWFPDYCQDAGDQAVADIRYSIIEGGWPGEGNTSADPLVADPAGGDFTLLSGSPALDSGFGGPATKSGVATAQIRAALAMDRARSSRQDLACVVNTGAGDVPYIDRGPLEAQPDICDPQGTARFIRADINDDRVIDISDPLAGLFVLFASAQTNCDDALDANDDGLRNLADILFILNFLFQNGPAIADPFPTAGTDTTGDSLTCDRHLP